MLIHAIDGCIGHRMETLKRVVLIVSHARRIPKKQPEKNEGTRRQFGHPLQHLVECQIVEPGEAHAVGERLERTAKLDCPIPFKR